MNMEEKERIIIPDENGDEHLFDELFKFTVDETGKSYLLVTPVGDEKESDDEEEVEVFAFRYEENTNENDDISLFPIETDEEWDMVEEMLDTLAAEDEE